MRLKTNRLETLVDGIFAIVMTVLVLNFSEILVTHAPKSEKEFFQLFVLLDTNFFAYALSFFLLGVLWLEHHRQSHFIKYVDSMFIFLNLALLMFLSFIPLSSLMLGNHERFLFPIFAFEINILIVNVLFYAHWAYATHRYRLISTSLSKTIILQQRRILILCVIFSLVAICLVDFFPLVSLLTLTIVPFLMIFKMWGNVGRGENVLGE